MTAAEIQQRVDAWLDARSVWLGQDDARWSLASQWQAVSRQFGAASPAALGVLLGLVRAAHKEPRLAACGFSSPISCGCWQVRDPDHPNSLTGFRSAGDGEAEALLAALEAAP